MKNNKIINSIIEAIETLKCFKYELEFTYWTKIYPCTTKPHWCKFYHWEHKTEMIGWYVLNKYGQMVPWVHYKWGKDEGIMCLYPSMITPIEK